MLIWKLIRCYECGEEWVFGDLQLGCLVIYDLVISFKAEKRKVNVDDAWLRVSLPPFSQSWSSGWRVSLAFLWSGSAVGKFVFRSDKIGFSLFLVFFYREGHGLAEKVLLIIFIFLTNFIDISLRVDSIHRSPFFHFEKSLSTDNIRWMLSWILVRILILLVRQIWRDLFRSYNSRKRARNPVALLRSLSDRYPWERYESAYPPSYGLNSTWKDSFSFK